MAKIDTSCWKEYRVDELFYTEKQGKNVQVPTGAMMAKKSLKEGLIPRVTVSNYNNGITGYYAESDDANYRIYENFISVSFLGTVFYQPERASLDMKVHCLKPLDIELNKYIASFLVTVIRKSILNFVYSDQLSSTVLPLLVIKLPSTADGKPDFAYMESYMRKIIEESEACLENLRRADKSKTIVKTEEWKDFKVGDLFEKLQLGIKNPNFNKALDVSEVRTAEFNLPLVNAKHGNNGIMYYGREEDFETAEMTIDIVQNGAIATGDVYAQPKKTGVLWDAYLVRPLFNISSEYALMFLATVIEKAIKDKFSYDDKCVWDKASQLYVKLPVSKEGKPDIDYMENYMSEILKNTAVSLKMLTKVTCR